MGASAVPRVQRRAIHQDFVLKDEPPYLLQRTVQFRSSSDGPKLSATSADGVSPTGLARCSASTMLTRPVERCAEPPRLTSLIQPLDPSHQKHQSRDTSDRRSEFP